MRFRKSPSECDHASAASQHVAGEHAADVAGLIGGISMLVTAVKKLGGYWRTQGAKTRRRTYTDSGQERESAELDDDKPVADQIEPPTGVSEKPA